jgi:broad specificity phosphatase PhoE
MSDAAAARPATPATAAGLSATTFLLVRHGAHAWLGRGIAGRLSGVGLDATGRAQARALAEQLCASGITAIHCSPQQRTRETAAPLAARLELPVQAADEFDEIDFCDWTGREFGELQADAARWRRWVEQRSTATPPGGEPFAQVQRRAMAGLQRLQALHPDASVLVVSHGDVIKALLAGHLGLSLDHLERFEIAPASLSVVAAGAGWSQVRLVNRTLEGLAAPG